MVARGNEVASPHMQKISGSIPDTDLYCASGPQGVLLCKWGEGVTTSRLDLSSLTPLSVSGCGRLHLGSFPLGYFIRTFDN